MQINVAKGSAETGFLAYLALPAWERELKDLASFNNGGFLFGK